jgi:hypothetical protein
LNAPLLRHVTLFKMPAIWMHPYCLRSRFLKCQTFECISIASGHTFNAGHLNASLMPQVTLFKMPAIWISFAPGHAFQNAGQCPRWRKAKNAFERNLSIWKWSHFQLSKGCTCVLILAQYTLLHVHCVLFTWKGWKKRNSIEDVITNSEETIRGRIDTWIEWA